jgi:hypothetical protein
MSLALPPSVGRSEPPPGGGHSEPPTVGGGEPQTLAVTFLCGIPRLLSLCCLVSNVPCTMQVTPPHVTQEHSQTPDEGKVETSVNTSQNQESQPAVVAKIVHMLALETEIEVASNNASVLALPANSQDLLDAVRQIFLRRLSDLGVYHEGCVADVFLRPEAPATLTFREFAAQGGQYHIDLKVACALPRFPRTLSSFVAPSQYTYTHPHTYTPTPTHPRARPPTPTHLHTYTHTPARPLTRTPHTPTHIHPHTHASRFSYSGRP